MNFAGIASRSMDPREPAGPKTWQYKHTIDLYRLCANNMEIKRDVILVTPMADIRFAGFQEYAVTAKSFHLSLKLRCLHVA